MNFRVLLASTLLALGAARADSIVGIGIVLAIDELEGLPVVAEVIPNSPAARAGLPTGAVIHRINGAPTAGLKIEECLARLRGEEKIPVLLDYVDPATGKSRKMIIVRGKFEIER